MNIFIKASIIISLCAGVVLLLFPISWFPSFYDVRYMGFSSLAYAVLIIFLPRLARVSEVEENATQKNQAANLFQLTLATVFFSNAVGDLGLYKLYKVGFEFDKLLHFAIPFLCVIIFSIILNQRWGISKNHAIAAAFGVVIFCSVAWEVYEYTADIILKTHISGVYGLNISVDTKFDLIYDALGAVLGASGGFLFWNLFVRWTKKVV